MENSNDQTSGWKAALSFPGNLWWILPLLFFGSIGYDYWHSAYDNSAFDPVWLRIVVITVFGGALCSFIVGVIASEKKKS